MTGSIADSADNWGGGRSRLKPLLPLVLALSPVFGGCAVHSPARAVALPDVELTDVPFFAQTEYQCGPAALATILAHEGLAVSAEALAPAVYVEGLRGSLQAELLGATRRKAFVPYVLEPTPQALAAEVAAGRPVLVLQNLGLRRVPVWHYSVVVGFDPARDRVILRSGTEQRRLERKSAFLRSWERAGSWAFVALPPGTLAATASPDAYIRAVAGAEALLGPSRAGAAYDGARRQWPDDPLVLFATAVHYQQQSRLDEATSLYRHLLDREPQHSAARNNLAHALAGRGCHDAALAEAETALAQTAAGGPLHAAVADTVRTLRARGRAPDAAQCP